MKKYRALILILMGLALIAVMFRAMLPHTLRASQIYHDDLYLLVCAWFALFFFPAFCGAVFWICSVVLSRRIIETDDK